jgi:hypothetical protein
MTQDAPCRLGWSRTAEKVESPPAGLLESAIAASSFLATNPVRGSPIRRIVFST